MNFAPLNHDHCAFANGRNARIYTRCEDELCTFKSRPLCVRERPERGIRACAVRRSVSVCKEELSSFTKINIHLLFNISDQQQDTQTLRIMSAHDDWETKLEIRACSLGSSPAGGDNHTACSSPTDSTGKSETSTEIFGSDPLRTLGEILAYCQ
ncbi:uncharacterized protein LOC113530542, partial [Tachysurus ichikawai]